MKKITFLMVAFLATSLTFAQVLEIEEGFEDITILTDWDFVNASTDADNASSSWAQPDGTVFEAHEGDPGAYISVNFNSTTGVGTINNWAILPELTLSNGDELKFWSRTVDGQAFPDRLEVRISPDGSATLPIDDGSGEDVGSYSELLFSINPDLEGGDAYPDVWTEYTVLVDGLAAPTMTRLALRYYVTEGGPSGSNSNFIGVDTLSLTTFPLTVGENAFDGFSHFVNANDEFVLRASTQMENVVIYNTLGQQVINTKLANTNEAVNVAALNSGVYIATVSINGASKTVKFVKK
ncbi:choice-of-anchor J domain-containing protein [Patiriisocius sp. Uisw_017]|uniref:choice-of-anchor J domain-containing protein n=1 Tax=Patiriisocius sp. Uisw_017 TaxID=3230968 RepID=UPI0039ED29E5